MGMRKVLFLSALILLSATALFAQGEEAEDFKVDCKSYNIGDGGVVEVLPKPSGMLFTIKYSRVSDAPLKARELLGINKQSGRVRGGRDKIKVQVFDTGGHEICRQFVYYGDFVLSQNKNGASIAMEFNPSGCGKYAYENLGNITVEY
jgi:hypothetical protein